MIRLALQVSLCQPFDYRPALTIVSQSEKLCALPSGRLARVLIIGVYGLVANVAVAESGTSELSKEI